jgi:hypothetical protein
MYVCFVCMRLIIFFIWTIILVRGTEIRRKAAEEERMAHSSQRSVASASVRRGGALGYCGVYCMDVCLTVKASMSRKSGP